MAPSSSAYHLSSASLRQRSSKPSAFMLTISVVDDVTGETVFP